MKYFTLKELSASGTARRMGVDNTPTPVASANLTALVEAVLDPLRERYGRPIYVSSGYRCPRLNNAVGGAKTSQHVSGEAVDIYVASARDRAQLFSMIYYLLPFDQLIWERGTDEDPEWIHVSYREGNNRRQCLRYDGKSYQPFVPRNSAAAKRV